MALFNHKNYIVKCFYPILLLNDLNPRSGCPPPLFERKIPGVINEKETPVPISNTEVKLLRADDTLHWGK